ncbi:MAG: nucleotidyltransferase family protein [Chloroflexota bacterium]
MTAYDLLMEAICWPDVSSHNMKKAELQKISRADLIQRAEIQGVSPLLYQTLSSTPDLIPLALKRELQALYVRHRHASQTRMTIALEVMSAYETQKIDVLWLKGFALAHLVYPEPALRPMRDMDLLVAPEQAILAQQTLTSIGFEAPLPSTSHLPSKHLEAATLQREGFTISIEVHHNAFHDDFYASLSVPELSGPPLAFQIGNKTAYTLGYEDMLWHLCGHIVNIAHPVKLIWISDIVRFAEMFKTKIDWDQVRVQYPNILHMLSLFHTMMPLSAELRDIAKIQVGPQPSGLGEEFQGWPRYSMQAQRHKGIWGILTDTFLPPEWWLRLYYSLGSARSIHWHRWVRHPFHILGFVRQLLLES